MEYKITANTLCDAYSNDGLDEFEVADVRRFAEMLAEDLDGAVERSHHDTSAFVVTWGGEEDGESDHDPIPEPIWNGALDRFLVEYKSK